MPRSYPALYGFNLRHGFVPLSSMGYGLFAGSTIHEVAQVVAAGHAVDHQAATIAVIAKMVRVMMLAPFLVALSAFLSRSAKFEGASPPVAGRRRAASHIVIPWFAVGFIVVAGLNSLALLPQAAVGAITNVDSLLLAMAMAALGLTTHVSAIRRAGLRPLALAVVLFAWLIVGGLMVNLAIAHLG